MLVCSHFKTLCKVVRAIQKNACSYQKVKHRNCTMPELFWYSTTEIKCRKSFYFLRLWKSKRIKCLWQINIYYPVPNHVLYFCWNVSEILNTFKIESSILIMLLISAFLSGKCETGSLKKKSIFNKSAF